MRVKDITDYLSKKTAKPFAYDVAVIDDDEKQRRFYSVEIVCVRDNEVEALVAFKYLLRGGDKIVHPHHCGETTIPLRDGDTIETFLDMAIATTDFAEHEGRVEAQQDRARFKRAYKAVQQRLTERAPEDSPPAPHT